MSPMKRGMLAKTHSWCLSLTGVPCVSWGYGGTEGGHLSINIWIHEDQPRYVLMPHMAVFEFIPEKNRYETDSQRNSNRSDSHSYASGN